MSRIGKQPVSVPAGVKVTLGPSAVALEGPKGKQELALHPAVLVQYDETARRLTVSPREMAGLTLREVRKNGAMWGTTRRLLETAVLGVSQGYTRQVQVVGVGYSARIEAGTLILRCGYANEIKLAIPADVKVAPPEVGNIMVTGIGQMPCTTLTFTSPSKQAVGQFAASVRHARPPEPYKTKGVRYMNEEIKRKAGKALAAGAK